jgi:hypothetical protein
MVRAYDWRRPHVIRGGETNMSGPACFREKLVIVSHVVHYKSAGSFYAYAPYAREINIWADMFEEILIAAPCREQEPPGDCALLEGKNFSIAPQRELGGETLSAKAKLLFSVPIVCWELARAMRQGDAIHVRCPGNLGLLGSIFAPLFSKHLVAKFAGQWNSSPGEPWSNRVQRAVLRSRWWGSPVTVYGRWPGEPRHIIPFFNSVMTARPERTTACFVCRPPVALEECRRPAKSTWKTPRGGACLYRQRCGRGT